MRGQTRTKRAAAPITLVLLLVALGGCARTGRPAGTVLVDAAGATVVAPSGQAHPGVDGEVLVAGDTLLSGVGMPALDDGGRNTTLAPDSAVHLVDADSYQLISGQLVVVHRRGPDLAVSAGGVLVDHLARGAVRIARGFAVRVAVYDGGVRVTAGASTSDVPALHEVLVPGEALPTVAFPLALSDDALDRVADPGLVSEDVTLDSAAAAVDAEASLGPAQQAGLLRATSAAFVHPLPGEPLSERLMPLAIARGGPGAVAARYAAAREYRLQGGSWAVVADLMDAQLAAVESVLVSVEDAAATAPAVLALAGGGPAGAGGSLPAAAPGSVPGSVPGPVPGSVPGPMASPTPRPSPSPSPSPSPGPVQQVLDIVSGLASRLPATPTPTAAAASRPGTAAVRADHPTPVAAANPAANSAGTPAAKAHLRPATSAPASQRRSRQTDADHAGLTSLLVRLLRTLLG